MQVIAVFDTNVLLSAVGWKGNPFRCLELARAGTIEVVTCQEIIDELAEKLESRLAQPSDVVTETLTDLLAVLRVESITGDVKEIEADPDDDKVLECAFIGHATHIVSGDRKHLLPLGHFRGISIVSPAEFLRVIATDLDLQKSREGTANGSSKIGEEALSKPTDEPMGQGQVKASMLEFARTGQLGPLRCGMSRDELLAAVGPPSDWMLDTVDRIKSRMETSGIWWYGDVEFHFDEDRVWMIFSDHSPLTDGGKTLLIDPWIIRAELPRLKFEAELTLRGIEFKTVTYPYAPDEVRVVTSHGAEFLFIEFLEDAHSPPAGLNGWSIVSPHLRK